MNSKTENLKTFREPIHRFIGNVLFTYQHFDYNPQSPSTDHKLAQPLARKYCINNRTIHACKQAYLKSFQRTICSLAQDNAISFSARQNVWINLRCISARRVCCILVCSCVSFYAAYGRLNTAKKAIISRIYVRPHPFIINTFKQSTRIFSFPLSASIFIVH